MSGGSQAIHRPLCHQKKIVKEEDAIWSKPILNQKGVENVVNQEDFNGLKCHYLCYVFKWLLPILVSSDLVDLIIQLTQQLDLKAMQRTIS